MCYFKSLYIHCETSGMIQKGMRRLEKAGIIQRSLSPYTSPIVIEHRKGPPGSPVEEAKDCAQTIES